MPLAPNEFRAELARRVEAMRWKGHRWFQKFFARELRLEDVRFWHEQQFYVTGHAHELFAPLYLKCDDPVFRTQILKSLLEEETGCDTKTAAHRELFVRVGLALGNTRERYEDVRPLPETAALRHYWEWLGHHRSFVEGLAGIAVAGEGQMPGMANRIARELEEQFGLTHEQTAAWWAHDEADTEHAGTAMEAVVKLATTDLDQKLATRALDLSLEMMWMFLSGLYRVRVEDRTLP